MPSVLQNAALDRLKHLASTGDPQAIRILSDAGLWTVGDRRIYTFADLKIRRKDKQLVTFEPNAVQQLYLDEITPRWRSGDYAMTAQREIILKARQFGFSTLILALFFLDTVNNPETQTKVMAHDTDTTELLFGMVHRFYNNLPSPPPTKYSTRRELAFSHNGSFLSVQTAGSMGAGRGGTPTNIHCSEVAFWPDPEIFTGLMQSLPLNGNCFEETTANGLGNEFYDQYQDAKLGLSNFTPRFYAWFDHPEYSVVPAPDFEPTVKELELIINHGVTYDQLQWRRNKIKEPGMGDKFVQEYPANDTEAFRVSGSTFFDRFDKAKIVKRAMFTPTDPPPNWYVARGGLDWGFADPFAFVLSFKDERQKWQVTESFEQARLSNEAQADMVCDCIKRWGVSKDKFLLICDGSMFYKKTINAIQFPPDIEAFQKAGLICVPAASGEEANKFRNNQVRDNFDGSTIEIYEGYNTRLVKCIEMAKHDPLKPERLLHDAASHMVVALGNAISPYGEGTAKPAPNETHPQAEYMADPESRYFQGPGKDDRPYL